MMEMLKQQVPANAVQYCWELWHEFPFHFTLARSRSSKLGDFRHRADREIQRITLNHDLNIYQFLITYIHEVAHHRAFKIHGIRIKPHGVEWKRTFQRLMNPMLSDRIFPKDLLLPLKRHMQNPRASTGADFFLLREIRKYDRPDEDRKTIYLSDLKPGADFILKGRKFKKESTRRTRILCLEVATGKKYLISGSAEVDLSGLSC